MPRRAHGVDIREASRNQRNREGAVAATTAETISSIRVVQALSLQTMFSGLFSSASLRSQAEGDHGAREKDCRAARYRGDEGDC